MAKKFEIKLYCESNDLHAMIQVISISEIAAVRFSKRKFFPGKSWEVTSVKEVKT